MAANLCDLSGGYFVGRPTNHAPDSTDEPAAGGSSGGGEHTPGGAFILSSPSRLKQDRGAQSC